MRSPEELAHLAARLGRELLDEERRRPAGVLGTIVHEMSRDELEAAWRTDVLVLDRGMTYRLEGLRRGIPAAALDLAEPH